MSKTKIKKITFDKNAKNYDGKSPVNIAINEFLSGIKSNYITPPLIQNKNDVYRIIYKYYSYKDEIVKVFIKILEKLQYNERVLFITTKGKSISISKNSLPIINWIVNIIYNL